MVTVTNNLHELMVKECANRTLKEGKKCSMQKLDSIFAEKFGKSKYSIMAMRQNKYQPKIEDAILFCEHFNITLYEFFNIEWGKNDEI